MIDLIELDIVKFDVILGIDWLGFYRTIVDYHNKMVKFDMPKELTFGFHGDQVGH